MRIRTTIRALGKWRIGIHISDNSSSTCGGSPLVSALSWLRYMQGEKGECTSAFCYQDKRKVLVYMGSCGQPWEDRMDTMDAASWSTAKEANCDRNSPVSVQSHSLVSGSCIPSAECFLSRFHTALPLVPFQFHPCARTWALVPSAKTIKCMKWNI